MFLVLKLLFSGLQRIYEKGVLFSLAMVKEIFLFLVLKTLIVPFSHAEYHNRHLQRYIYLAGRT